MTNVNFSSALQAPISLGPPAAALTLVGAPPTELGVAALIPPAPQLSLVGAAVRLSLNINTATGALAVAADAPTVTSGLVTLKTPLAPTLTVGGSAPTSTVGAPSTGPSFPRVAVLAVGGNAPGDQSYGNNAAAGFPGWRAAAVNSTPYTNVQQIGAFDLAILGGTWEGTNTLTQSWDSNGARDREDLTLALAKQANYTVTKNRTRVTLCFYYGNKNEGATTDVNYHTWIDLVQANNWWLREAANGAGTITPSAFAGSLINYSTAWPGTVNGVGAGQSIAGTAYGTLSNGQGPTRTNARYQVSKLLSKSPTDARFTGKWNPKMASPSAAGVFMDNVFVSLNGGGSVANSSLDGSSTLASGTANTVQPLMMRGHFNFYDEYQTHLAALNPGKTYYSFGNITQLGDTYDFGDIAGASSNALLNTMHGGLLESIIGNGGSSWEFWQTGGTLPSGWQNVRKNYYYAMDFCLAPKLVIVGCRVPSTDGSGTASFAVNGTLTTVTTGTALEYQLMRYALSTTLLDDGYFGIGTNGYYSSLVRWYDEFGDDSLAQVNMPRGYMGQPLTSRPTSPTWPAKGTLGVWARLFSGDAVHTSSALVLCFPRGNGAQTVTSADLFTAGFGSGWRLLAGTQRPAINTGAAFASYTAADGDGLILVR